MTKSQYLFCIRGEEFNEKNQFAAINGFIIAFGWLRVGSGSHLDIIFPMIGSLVYLPTFLWLLGYLEATIQVLLVGPSQTTIGWSVYLTALLALVAFWTNRDHISRQFRRLAHELGSSPASFKLLVVISILMFILAGLEARLPPHLGQEYDAINYHMALPRQHILAGSFSHIPWSSADLFPLPIQWGFAPSWFMGSYFHKLPQFVAAVWAFLLLLDLGRSQLPRSYLGWLPAIAVFTTHGVMIQLGTAMLDLMGLYLLLASIHALRRQRPILAVLNLALYVASKSFRPAEIVIVMIIISGIYLVSRRRAFLMDVRKVLPLLSLTAVLAIVLLGRSALIGARRAGTPLYPFFTCQIINVAGCRGQAGEAIRQSAELLMKSGTSYGSGKDATSFIAFLWRVSVPTHSRTNNEFDYPLGLAWLLMVVLLSFSIPIWVKKGSVPLFGSIAIAFLIVWWIGSHQSRWLYPVMAFGWLAIAEMLKTVSPKVIVGLLLVSASFSLVSEWRALSDTIFLPRVAIQLDQEATTHTDEELRIVTSALTLYVDFPVDHNLTDDPLWFLAK